MLQGGCVTFLKGLLIVILGTVAVIVIYGQSKAIRAFINEQLIDESDLVDQKCIVRLPYSVAELLRPPIKSCDFCMNLTSVEKVSNITSEDFELKYAYSGVPVVITDATKNWSATNTFSIEYLKLIFAGQTHIGSGCQFFNYQTEVESLEDFFDAESLWLNFSQPWYIGWSNCNPETVAKLRTEYQRPYFLPKHSMATSVDWIFIGTPNYGAHFHVDDVGDASWQAQLKGSKLWVLSPPPDCFYQCGMGRIEVLVEAGDILVLDTNIWYHSTKVVGDNLSISLGGEFD